MLDNIGILTVQISDRKGQLRKLSDDIARQSYVVEKARKLGNTSTSFKSANDVLGRLIKLRDDIEDDLADLERKLAALKSDLLP